MNKIAERRLKEAIETGRGTFKPVIEEQYRIQVENADSKELFSGKTYTEFELSQMSPRHKRRVLRLRKLSE